jgi:hypothetical protein
MDEKIMMISIIIIIMTTHNTTWKNIWQQQLTLTGELMGVGTGAGDRLMVVLGRTGVHPEVALMLSKLLLELWVELPWWPMNVLVSAELLATVRFLCDVLDSRSR